MLANGNRKHTEAGMVPSDWQAVRIADFCSTYSGGTPATSRPDYYGGPIPWISSGDLNKGVIEDVKGRITLNGLQNSSAKMVEAGTLLIALYGATAGVSAITHIPGAINQAVLAIKPRGADRNFLHAWLVHNRDRIIDTYTQGGQPNLSGEIVRKIMVPLPPEAEQRQIAGKLDDVSSVISTLKRLIAKKQAIRLGMMQQLLTGQTRLPGFSGDWIKKPLKDIVQTPITDGPHLTPKFLPIGIPFLSVNNLVDGKIDWDDVRYISRSDHAEFSKKCAPRRGDILLGKAASVGKVALVEADIQFNIWSPIAMIRIGREHDSRFVHYQLQSAAVENQIALLTNTSSQGNIGMGDIGKLVIGLPPHDEQVAIASALADADRDISTEQGRLAKAKSIKEGMMQELLSGRTRLTPKGSAT